MSPGEEGTEQTTVKPKLLLLPSALPAGSLEQAVMPLNSSFPSGSAEASDLLGKGHLAY